MGSLAGTKRKLRSGRERNTESHRKSKPIKNVVDVPDIEVHPTEDDIEFFVENFSSASFLKNFNQHAISLKGKANNLKKERPIFRKEIEDDLPSINSSEEEEHQEVDIEKFNSSNSVHSDSSSEARHIGALNIKYLDSEEEQEYERIPRNLDQKQKIESNRLPIKLSDGRIEFQEKRDKYEGVPVEKEDDYQDDSYRVDSDTDSSKIAVGCIQQDEANYKHDMNHAANHHVLMDKREELAMVSSKIMEDPEGHIGYLKTLRELAVDKSEMIQKLAILTQLVVYKDIIPGYRIRPLTEKEKQVKVSKEVKRLRAFEEGLISNYQQYLQTLEQHLSGKQKNNGAKSSLHYTAVQCMCELLSSVPHFNFRLNLLTAIVTQISGSVPTDVSLLCVKTLCELFSRDISGEASLDAVKLISRMIKDRGFTNVQPDVLRTFFSLRLLNELNRVRASTSRAEMPLSANDGKEKKKARKDKGRHLTKNQKKEGKERQEVERELKEAEAVIDSEEREKIQTETLKIVFAIYFRILKQAPRSQLLPLTLEGLSKFAHMINVDFFQDLLTRLKEIIEDSQRPIDNEDEGEGLLHNRPREILLCIVTAFELLSGQGEALNIDLSHYIRTLYKIIPRLATIIDSGETMNGSSQSIFDLLNRAMEFVFFKHKQVPVLRIMAFYKRLMILTLTFQGRSASAHLVFLLKLLRRVIIRYPKVADMIHIDHDEEGIAMGAVGNFSGGGYRMDLDDPEICNPGSAKVWEIMVLEKHYDPKVRTAARMMANLEVGKKVITA